MRGGSEGDNLGGGGAEEVGELEGAEAGGGGGGVEEELEKEDERESQRPSQKRKERTREGTRLTGFEAPSVFFSPPGVFQPSLSRTKTPEQMATPSVEASSNEMVSETGQTSEALVRQNSAQAPEVGDLPKNGEAFGSVSMK